MQKHRRHSHWPVAHLLTTAIGVVGVVLIASRALRPEEINLRATAARETPLAAMPSTRELLALPSVLDPENLDGGPETGNPQPEVMRFAGTIVAKQDGSPLANHEVTFLGQHTATSDTDGRFKIDLPPQGGLERNQYYALNIENQGETVFRGSARLGSDALIWIEPPVVLHGEVDLQGQGELPFPLAIGVSLAGPDRGVDSSIAVLLSAKGQVRQDGRFALRARPHHRPDTAEVRLVSSEKGLSATLHVPLADLMSPSGARLRLDTAPLKMVVTDGAGQPVEHASVRIWQPSTRDVAEKETDQSGRCSFLTTPGLWSWAAFKPGHQAMFGQIDTGTRGLELSCTLAPSISGFRLTGEVISASSQEPVSRAMVSAWPGAAADSLMEAGAFDPPYDSTRTDDRGSFSLAVPREDDICLIVRHGLVVRGPRVILEKGTSSIRLVMERAGRLFVERQALVDEPNATGPTRLLLVDRARPRTVSMTGYPPFAVPELAPGSYNIVMVNSLGSYGQTTAEVLAGKDLRVTVGTVPGTWFEGDVVDKAGVPIANASVQLRQEGWSEEVSKWCAARTDAEGRFRLLGGPWMEGKIFVSFRDVLVAQQAVTSGRRVHVVSAIPDRPW